MEGTDIVPTFRWVVEFDLPGSPITEPATLGNIELTPALPDETRRSRSVGRLIFDTDHYLYASELTEAARDRLEPLAAAAAALGGSVLEPKITSAQLENRKELEDSGVRIPLEAYFRNTIHVDAPAITSGTLLLGHSAMLAMSSQEIARWRLAARWLWKANSDPNAHDQFVALWIAFNVLYGPRLPGVVEQQAIEDFVASEFPSEPEAVRFLDGVRPEDLRILAASALTVGLGKNPRPVASQLHAALALAPPQQSPRSVVSLACLVIYAARCDIVHNGAAALAPREKELRLVWASIYVLKPLIMRVFRRRLGL